MFPPLMPLYSTSDPITLGSYPAFKARYESSSGL